MHLFKSVTHKDPKDLGLLLRLLNTGDEGILYTVFKKKVFNKKVVQNVSESDIVTLHNFYLGYCTPADETGKKADAFRKVILRSQGYFMPLMSDWFFRPLYYLEHLDKAQCS